MVFHIVVKSTIWLQYDKYVWNATNSKMATFKLSLSNPKYNQPRGLATGDSLVISFSNQDVSVPWSPKLRLDPAQTICPWPILGAAGCFWYLMVNVDRSRPKNWFYECAVKGCWTFGQFSCYTSHVSFSNHCCRWSELLKDQGLSGKGWIDSLQWSLASVEPRNKTLITFHHQNLLFNGDSYHGIFNQPY